MPATTRLDPTKPSGVLPIAPTNIYPTNNEVTLGMLLADCATNRFIVGVATKICITAL